MQTSVSIRKLSSAGVERNDDSEKSVAIYAKYLADAVLAARTETEINHGKSE